MSHYIDNRKDRASRSPSRLVGGSVHHPTTTTLDYDRRREAFFGVLFGIALTANYVASAVNHLTGLNGLFPLTMGLVGVATVLHGGVKAARSLTPVLLWMAGLLLLSVLFVDGDYAAHHAKAFLVIGIPAVLVASQRFSHTHALTVTQVAGVIGLPYLLSVSRQQVDLYDAEWMMGLAYACLPVAFSGILIIGSSSFSRAVRLIALLNVASVALLAMQFMSRGVFLSIVLFATLVWLRRIFVARGSSVVRMMIEGSTVVVVFGFLASSDVVMRLVARTAIFQRFGAMTNFESLTGRNELWGLLTIPRGVISVILGSGAGSFESVSGGVFPHSIFGEVYFELGIVPLTVLVIWLVRLVRSMLTSADPAVWRVLVVILAGSAVRLTVSYTFWLDVGFWLLVGFSRQALSEPSSEMGEASEGHIS